eukprot:GHVS01045366.1.p2 GENE.GHVS01045366.1~~GHVS01045366.1.p2  ORF type:complete len:106 (-),score=4.93 GHVS01045366.1:54-371(-)
MTSKSPRAVLLLLLGFCSLLSTATAVDVGATGTTGSAKSAKRLSENIRLSLLKGAKQPGVENGHIEKPLVFVEPVIHVVGVPKNKPLLDPLQAGFKKGLPCMSSI